MSCEAQYEYGQRDDCRSEWDSANEVINCRLVFANYFSQDECAHAGGQKKKPQRSKRRLDVATQIHDRDRRKQRNQPNSPFLKVEVAAKIGRTAQQIVHPLHHIQSLPLLNGLATLLMRAIQKRTATTTSHIPNVNRSTFICYFDRLN